MVCPVLLQKRRGRGRETRYLFRFFLHHKYTFKTIAITEEQHITEFAIQDKSWKEWLYNLPENKITTFTWTLNFCCLNLDLEKKPL